jgi:ABC-type Na+ efflux pump permease subunit
MRWAELPGRLLGPMFALDAARVGRRRSTFVVRWLYLGVLLVVLGLYFWDWSGRSLRGTRVAPQVLASFAEEFFWAYAVTQFLVVAALTPALTAAAITDEKERKTLDFLLVTDLSPREIVFGKLASRAGVLFTLVLAGLPVVSLIQFFGGIDPQLPLAAAGVTLATVASLAAVAVACSALVGRTRDAVVLAYGLPVAYLILSAVVLNQAELGERFHKREFAVTVAGWKVTTVNAAEALAAGNIFVLAERYDRGATDVPRDAARYGAFHVLVAVAGFALAAGRLRATARGASGRPRGKVGQLVAWASGKRTTARPHPPVTDEPVAWREVYVEPGSGAGWVRRLLAAGVVFAVVWPLLAIIGNTLIGQTWHGSSRNPEPLRSFQEGIRLWVCGVTGGLGTLMLLSAAVRGAASVAGEKDRDTWASLLTTPLTASEILCGKWRGCVWGQRHALYLLGGVWAVGVVTVSVNPVALALTAVALAAYLSAFAWLGISYSIAARNARVATAQAVPTAILAGGGFWVVLGCCGGLMAGAGELLIYPGLAVLAATPPVVLGGLPAVTFRDVLDVLDSTRPRIHAVALALFAGYAVGTTVWFCAAAGLKARSIDLLTKDANRG